MAISKENLKSRNFAQTLKGRVNFSILLFGM
jgi:hypothetical protein